MSKGKKKNASEQNEARALILRILVGFVAGMIVMLLMMAIFSSITVSYTHLTLPTNSLV